MGYLSKKVISPVLLTPERSNRQNQIRSGQGAGIFPTSWAKISVEAMEEDLAIISRFSTFNVCVDIVSLILDRGSNLPKHCPWLFRNFESSGLTGNSSVAGPSIEERGKS